MVQCFDWYLPLVRNRWLRHPAVAILLLVAGLCLSPRALGHATARLDPAARTLLKNSGHVWQPDLRLRPPTPVPARYSVALEADLQGGLIEFWFSTRHLLVINLMDASQDGVYLAPGRGKPWKRLLETRAPEAGDETSRIREGVRLIRRVRLRADCDLESGRGRLEFNGRTFDIPDLGTRGARCAVRLFEPGNSEARVGRLELRDADARPLFRFSARGPEGAFCRGLRALPWLGGALFFAGLLLGLRALPAGARGNLLGLLAALALTEAFLRDYARNESCLNIGAVLEGQEWIYEKMTGLFDAGAPPAAIRLTNTLHARDRAVYPLPPPGDRLRIVCMGSSPVQGMGLSPEEDAPPAVLERLINQARPGRPCLVLNDGMRGLDFCEPITAIHYRDVLMRWRPDLLIVYSTLESDPARADAFYRGYERLRQLVAANKGWIRNDRMLLAAMEFRRPLRPVVEAYDLLRNSYVFMGLEWARRRLMVPDGGGRESSPGAPDPRREALKRFWNDTACMLPDMFSPLAPGTPPPDSYADVILEIARRQGTRVVLLPFMHFPLAGANLEEARFWGDLPYFEKIRRQPHVRVLRTDEAFRARAGEPLYFNTTHMNDEGSRLLAVEIFRKLVREKLI